MGKEPACNAGDNGDMSSIPGSERSHWGGYSNPPPYSCLENLMNRGAWQATVQCITKSQTWLKQHSPHTHTTIWYLCILQNCNYNKFNWYTSPQSYRFPFSCDNYPSIFQVYNTILLTVVTMMYIVSPGLIYLITCSLLLSWLLHMLYLGCQTRYSKF